MKRQNSLTARRSAVAADMKKDRDFHKDRNVYKIKMQSTFVLCIYSLFHNYLLLVLQQSSQ